MWRQTASTPEIPRNILVINNWQDMGSDTSLPQLGFLEPQDCETKSYLQCESHSNLNFSISLNRAVPSKFPNLESLYKLTNPDVIVMKDGSTWNLKIKKQSFNVPLNWTPASAPSDIGPLTDAISKALGYDGIVLDQRDSYLLIGGSSARLSPDDIQGLVLGGSEKSPSIARDSFKGSALIGK